jgi:hypothetical protein
MLRSRGGAEHPVVAMRMLRAHDEKAAAAAAVG